MRPKLSGLYLTLVPFLTIAIGFGIGPVSYKIYLPVWIIHSCLMATAAWVLAVNLIKSPEAKKKQLAVAALLMVIPWIFFTIFAGMGRPPATAAGWVAKATEQQIRYAILVAGGVLMCFGFVLLREGLKKAGENLYSLVGLAAILIATPIYIINMLFWGNYLVEAFRLFASVPPAKRPDWFLLVRELFGAISSVEVALLYLATAAFAASLKVTGFFSPITCRIYILFSGIGFALGVLPPSLPEPFATAGYLVAVPAIPFVMPYLMGVNLLKLYSFRTVS